MNKSTRYSPEVRKRAVRMVFGHRGEHDSQWYHLRDTWASWQVQAGSPQRLPLELRALTFSSAHDPPPGLL